MIEGLKIKLQGDYKWELARMATESGVTSGDVLRTFVNDYVHGRYEYREGHIVPTDTYRGYINAECGN